MSDPADQILRDRLTERLDTLRREYATGEQQIAALDARAAELRSTLLRISGAVQVLEEMLVSMDEASAPGHPAARAAE